MSKFVDPIVEGFVRNYGILNLLDDLHVKKVRASRKPNYIACCPLHDDASESFSINVKTGQWKCFVGCGQGSLYNFVQLSYNLSYQEAKEFIAARAGFDSSVNLEDITFLRDILNLTESIEDEETVNWAKVFEDAETASKRMYEGIDPHGYLASRGFSEETIKYFECGYTKDYLGYGYKKQERITIPGHDEHGKLVGFIGRTPINAEPKYLYTSGYPKSYTLFNLHRAKKYGDEGLIVVEGSLDVFRVHNHGYPNVVGALGAHLSEYQIKLLKKYTDRVYLMLDNDKAGYTGNMDGLEQLKDILDVYHVPLKPYNDPGDILQKSVMDNIMAKKKRWFEFELRKGGILDGKPYG